MGHEEWFPPTRLSAGYGFRKETNAGVRHNGRDAPIPAVRERPESTDWVENPLARLVAAIFESRWSARQFFIASVGNSTNEQSNDRAG
jgi:hypothetical protein